MVQMRIGIDARFSRSPGVSRYYTSLIKHLARIDADNEYAVFYASQEEMQRVHPRQSNFRATVIGADAYHPSEQPKLCFHLWRAALSLFHATNSWVVPLIPSCPLVVTVHDLIPKTHPELISRKARLYSRLMVPYAVGVANRILTVSDYSRGTLLSHYPEAREKTLITYNGTDLDFSEPVDPKVLESTKAQYGIAGDYILFVGALMEHKNIFRLLEAYDSLEPFLQSRYTLVVLGRRLPGHENFVESVRERAARNSRVALVHYVEEIHLPMIYAGASAFVFPSLQEGFGIPLVEAMSASLPIVAAHSTAIPEICGDAALYVDPQSVESIRDGLTRVLSDDRLRQRLKETAKARASRFKWETTACATLRVYEDVHARAVQSRRKSQ